MTPTSQPPDSAARPSAVAQEAVVGTEAPAPAIAEALPPPDPTDSSPTIISLTRPRSTGDGPLPAGLHGKHLGHFELVEAVGVGGMAAVIRAIDLQLGRTVALKILPPEMAAEPENITRFKNEARAAAKLDHENIARVYFCGEDQGLHFIAFEFVEGEDLRSHLKRKGVLSPAEAINYLLQIASGLAHAAQRGVVHRDIKPSNILLTPEGRAKIVDMGLARHADPVQGAVTHSGVTLGTFDYISPEQAIEPRNADSRSDIYSLGCTFYHMLTGQPPVPDGTAMKKLHHHQHIEPVDPRQLNPAIPDELAAVLARCMAKEPRDRYQRPEHLIQHLIQVARLLQLPADSSSVEQVLFMDAPLPAPPRWSPILVGLAGVAAVAILAAIMSLGDSGRLPRAGRPAWGPTGSTPPLASATATVATPPTHPVNALPEAGTTEPKVARNVTELQQLLEDKVERIVLTENRYDLPQTLKVAANVKLAGRAGVRPVLRLITGDRPATGPLAAIHAVAGCRTLELTNLRFEVIHTDADTPVFALAADSLQQINIADCEFNLTGSDDPADGGALAITGPVSPETTLIELDRCWFAGGAIALRLVDRCRLRAQHCAFGSYDSVVVLRENAVPLTPEIDRVRAEFNHCSVRLRQGTIFQCEANVSGTLRAVNCVFTGEVGDESVLVKQNEPKGEVRFVGTMTEGKGRNAYQNLTWWVDPVRRATTLVEVRKRFLFEDVGAIELSKAPWLKLKPDETPAEQFLLSQTVALLRVPPRNEAMLGVQRGAWGDLYPQVLPTPTPEADSLAVVVDPELPTDESQRRYRDLEGAIRGAKPGDTIILATDSVLELRPIELDAADLRLTIQAKEGRKPVLRLIPETIKPHASLFTIYAGSMVFKDLRFRLGTAKGERTKSRSVVTMAGSGQCAFQNCLVTLTESGGVELSLATVGGDADQADAAPKIRLNRCFVRGRGDLIDVRSSRPFELDAEQSLVALDGSLVSVLGNSKEAPLAASALVTCKRVSAILSESFLELRVAEGDRKIIGLAPTQVRCEESLFVAGTERPFVHTVGVAQDSLKQLLQWEGRGNLYGNYTKMLHVELPEAMMVMPQDLSPRAWMTFTREPEESFARVTLARAPTSDRPYALSDPSDFRPRFSEMKRPEMTPADVGATLGTLPTGDDE